MGLSVLVIFLLVVLGLLLAGFLATVRRSAAQNGAAAIELGPEERARMVRLRKITTGIGELKASATEGSVPAIVAAEAQGEADRLMEEANRLLIARRQARLAAKHGAQTDTIPQIDARLDAAEEALGTLRTALAQSIAEPDASFASGLEDRLGQVKALSETLRELKA
ncbi:hypothetical protein EON79_18085 [bacterium]|nr:MAG: hypothetical protein EON79_18085 [bacterium]